MTANLQPPNTPLDFTALSSYLGSVGSWMDHALTERLPIGDPEKYLYSPAMDYPSRGGKRFRPALMLLAASLAGGDPARALPTATALELFQNFALVHDDIEDESHLRRGKPALHRIHGIPLAINVGDFLFNRVYEVLLENRVLLGESQAMDILEQFTEVVRHTLEGQAFDIGWVHSDHFPTREEYEKMIRLKTGWYSGRGPCQMGALIGGGSADLIAPLGNFGEKLGIGFQIRDDLLNLTADSAEQAPGANEGGYGKEHGGDIAEGKRTLILIELLTRISSADADRVKAIVLMPPQVTLEKDIQWVIDLAENTGALNAAQDRCRELGQEARQELAGLPDSPQKNLFTELTDFLVEERNF